MLRHRERMPSTFLSHQAPVLPLKARWPWLDGTALVVGTTGPDLAYALAGSETAVDAHTFSGVFVFALPVTVLITLIIRERAANAFLFAPDLGPARLRSWAVIGTGRPALAVTVFSAWIGAMSHALLDAFTHDRRWASDRIGILQRTWVEINDVPWSGANVLQWVGHGVGAAVTLGTLLWWGYTRFPERLYGEDVVDTVRQHRPSALAHMAFWSCVAIGFAVGLWWATTHPALHTQAIRVALGTCFGVLAGTWVTPVPAFREPSPASCQTLNFAEGTPYLDARR